MDATAITLLYNVFCLVFFQALQAHFDDDHEDVRQLLDQRGARGQLLVVQADTRGRAAGQGSHHGDILKVRKIKEPFTLYALFIDVAF